MSTLTEQQAPAATDKVLLSAAEQLSLGTRLTVSLVAAGCLLLSAAIQILRPAQRDVA